MRTKEIVPGIYWVGVIDWNLRNFHGYQTEMGSSYNAYLIIDDKITLVDTVKKPFEKEFLDNISAIIDPANIDYVVVNHVEMDHSGCLPSIMSVAKKATIITSPNGAKGLKHHYPYEWPINTVKNGDKISLGSRSLQFTLAPMVHWPDSMVSYLDKEKILFPNDAFGQHIASSGRFDNDIPFNIIEREAAKYYANIVMPFGAQISKLLDSVSELAIDIIAPSHGIIWKDHISKILTLYRNWSSNCDDDRAIIVYDTMWKSTERMVHTIAEFFNENNISYDIFNLSQNHISNIMTHVLSAKYLCLGSPTLNNTVLPTMAGFMSYLTGLAPKGHNKTGIAFGSYGWGGQSITQMENTLETCGYKLPVKGLKIQYIPNNETLSIFKGNLKPLLKKE